MKRFLPITFIPISFCFFLFIGCESKPANETGDLHATQRISIVTTTTQVNDIVRRLVGDSCVVTPLMGPGIDPHSYKPTAHDMNSISTADLVVFHGLKFEGKLASLLSQGHSKVTSYDVSSAVPKDLLIYINELPVPLDFIGLQIESAEIVEDQVIICELKAYGIREINSIRISNSLLIETIDDQVNIVNILAKESRKTINLNKRIQDEHIVFITDPAK